MRRALLIGTLVTVLAAPAALAADPAPADFKNAAKYCTALRESKGVDAFATQFGANTGKKNAYGKCVSATAKAKANQRQAAAEAKAVADCKKQRSDDAAAFATKYKTLGQCVKAQKAGT